jgi:hypothetical protein
VAFPAVVNTASSVEATGTTTHGVPLHAHPCAGGEREVRGEHPLRAARRR